MIDNYQTDDGNRLRNLAVGMRLYNPHLLKIGVKPIVVLPAFSGGSDLCRWLPSLVEFSCQREVPLISYSLVGSFHESSAEGNLDSLQISDHAKILKISLDFLEIKNIETVFGFSLGGMIAIQLLALCPNIARSFIIGAAAVVPPIIKLSNQLQIDLIEEFGEKALNHSRFLQRIICNSNTSLQENNDQDFERNYISIKVESQKFGCRKDIDAYRRTTMALNNFRYPEFSNEKSNVKVDIFSIEDDLYTPKNGVQKLHEILLNSDIDSKYRHLEMLSGHESWITNFDSIKNIIFGSFNA